MKFIAVIPSYDRSIVLRKTIHSVCSQKDIESIMLIIQSSNLQERIRYKELVRELNRDYSKELIAIWSNKPLSSAGARRLALELALQVFDKNYVVIMLEDDFILPPNEKLFVYLMEDFNLSPRVGCVIGNVINISKRKIDPDFYINNAALASALTRVTGYVFIFRDKGIRPVIFGSQFMILRLSLVEKGVNYDIKYQGTGFREESDIQLQIRKAGFITLFDGRIHVLHLAVEVGGNRGINSLIDRVYWKSRNHIYFLFKHFSGAKRLYCTIMSTLLLSIYSPISTLNIIKGIRDGMRIALKR